MKKDDFIELVQNTKFDEATKQLFITSYCLGHDQGKIETLKEVIERMDYSEILKELG